MQNIKSKTLALVAGVVVAVAGVSLYAANPDDNKTENKAATNQQPTKPTAKLTVSEDKKTVSYEGQTGKTALEVLKSLTSVTTKQSSYGEFVTGINGMKADDSKQFWAFYVNDNLASEGAGTYKTTNGEKIEWRMEDIQQ